MIWELRHPRPIVELRLLGERNFATANVLMLMLGFVLLGSTVLIPQLTQQLLGYTATLAGLVVSPGGVAVMCMMPVVGFLISRVDVRWLIAFGLVLSGSALAVMSTWSLDVDYRTLAVARIFQASGIAFLFVPISTVSYSFVPKEKTNAASGLINLARNMGGSIGIALLTTYLARRSQAHQSYLVAHVTPYDSIYSRTLAVTESGLRAHGLPSAQAARANLQLLYDQINFQAAMLAYADCFQLLAVFFGLAIFLVFLLKKPAPGTPVAVH